MAFDGFVKPWGVRVAPWGVPVAPAILKVKVSVGIGGGPFPGCNRGWQMKVFL